jgi:hypothetical protein
MTEFVRFDNRFEYTDPKSKVRTRYPAGWTGELDAKVVLAARKAKAVAGEDPSSELIAARKVVADAEAAEKAASTDLQKTKAAADLTAAREALAKLEG